MRLFSALLLLLVIPAGTFTALVTLHVQKQLTEQTLHQNAVLTKVMARALGEEFTRLQKEVEEFAYRTRLIQYAQSKGDDVALRAKLNELVRVNPSFSRAFLTDVNGNLRADYPNSSNLIGVNFAMRDWYKGAVARENAYVSEVYRRTNIDSASVVTIGTRVRDAKNNTIGYLGAQFAAGSISKWLENLHMGTGSTVFVLDQHGNPALVSPAAQELAANPSFQKLRDHSGLIRLKDKAGNELLVHYERVASIGWTIFSQQRAGSLFAPVRALLQTTALFGLLSIVTMTVIGLFWFKTISQFEAQRQRSDNELRAHARNLKRSNQELEGFCYSIAHDLRAPLRAMRGFGLALREEYGHALDATGQDYTKRICESAEYMDALTDGLLSYGRLSHVEMPITPVNLNEVLDKVCDDLEPLIRQTNACLEIKKPFASVLGNETALRQVIENLLSNALKFVPAGSTPSVKIWTEENSGKILLKVRDNGIGIDPAHQQRIFGVFERLHSREMYPGTGIGLALVRKSVERMSGSVGVESKLGQGACFWIALSKAP